MHNLSFNPKHQKATALLSALFIMTLVAIAATAVSLRLQLDIYRTQLTINSDKLYLASQSVVFWAMDQLHDKKNTFSTLGPLGQVADFPKKLANIYPELQIEGRVFDLQAKFNVNNLQKKQASIFFQNILNHILSSKSSKDNANISLAIQDWISSYSLEKGIDKFQAWYLKQTPPYYASHQLLTGISELRLIQGISASDYIAMFPYLTALPEYTPVNIKTTSPPILLSLKKEMTESQVEEILTTRKEPKADDKLKLVIAKLQLPEEMITLSSNYFLVMSIVSGNDLKLINYTILKRETSKKGEISVSLISESLNTM